MRAHGCIDSGSGLGADAHACWAFDQPQEFVDAALEYLTDGIRNGQRLAYVGSEPVEEQRERLAALGDVGAMIDKGALQLFVLSDLYDIGKPVDVDTQVAVYLAATDAALADGYTGLRVAAQVTDLVAEPACREAHVRWEAVADRFVSSRPLSALCGYSRKELPEPLISELATVHPAANVRPQQVPFHLFSDSGNLVLTGEVDLFSTDALDRAFSLVRQDDEPLSLDLGELEFIDRHGVEALAANVSHLSNGGEHTIHNPPYIVNRLCDLLELRL